MPDVPLPPPWDACAASFLQSIYDHSGSRDSLENYSYTLRAFFRDATRAPDSYVRSEIEAFLYSPSTSNRNRGAAVTPSTRNSRLKILNSFYKFAAGYEIVPGVSLLQSKPPTFGMRYAKVGPVYRAMSAEELERFFRAIPTTTTKGLRDYVMFLCYFILGRRRNELCRLQWKDIEVATIVDADGTRRPGYIYRYVGKGASRVIKAKEFPLAAWNALHIYLERSGRLATIQPNDYLFVADLPGRGRKDHATDRPLSGDYINGEFKRYCRLASLDATRYSLHSLRHTSAHERYSMGEDIRSIQQFLDHSSIATTDAYLRALAGISDPGAKLLEKRFGHLSEL